MSKINQPLFFEEDIMKRFTALLLILLALGTAAFADDAKVMPMMVGRVYVAPTFAFAVGMYDSDGNYKNLSGGSVKAFNLGFAVEYGVIDWITAAVQWAPGWTPWSDLGVISKGMKSGLGPLETLVPGNFEEANRNGVADLFVGAKFQIVGENAPIKSSTFRAAIGPGIIIPFPGPDFSNAATSITAAEKFTSSSNDNHVWAAGTRLYFDWIINEHFFLNLYNETIFYMTGQSLNKFGPHLSLMKGLLLQTVQAGAMPSSSVPTINQLDGTVNYQYKLTFEVEPVYSTSLADGITLSAGLPVNYVFKPAPKYDLNTAFDDLVMQSAGVREQFLGMAGVDASHILTVKPNVGIFFLKTPLPLEFNLKYSIPVWGKNVAMAAHSITLQGRVYFAIPKKK
jgi:hypothetical protein